MASHRPYRLTQAWDNLWWPIGAVRTAITHHHHNLETLNRNLQGKLLRAAGGGGAALLPAHCHPHHQADAEGHLLDSRKTSSDPLCSQ